MHLMLAEIDEAAAPIAILLDLLSDIAVEEAQADDIVPFANSNAAWSMTSMASSSSPLITRQEKRRSLDLWPQSANQSQRQALKTAEYT